MHQQERRSVATEIVYGDLYPVARGEAAHLRGTLACADFGKGNPAIAQPRDLDAVRGANAAFYNAFEGRDLDAMSRLWEHTERVLCTHPGWATLRGWAKVSASFFALFQNSQHLQFILTNERAEAAGDVAWVSVDENILDVDGATTVAALNVFVREPDGRWVMVAHHGSPVTASAEVPGPDEEDDEEEA